MSGLKRIRQAAGIPRIVLADSAGISRFRLYEAERGVRELTAEEKTAIQRVLKSALHKVILAAAEFDKAGIAQ